MQELGAHVRLGHFMPGDGECVNQFKKIIRNGRHGAHIQPSKKNRSAAFGRFVFGINISSRAQLESSRRQSAAKF
jgi:hypothetical protein